jgi:hypothetical protein
MREAAMNERERAAVSLEMAGVASASVTRPRPDERQAKSSNYQLIHLNLRPRSQLFDMTPAAAASIIRFHGSIFQIATPQSASHRREQIPSLLAPHQP